MKQKRGYNLKDPVLTSIDIERGNYLANISGQVPVLIYGLRNGWIMANQNGKVEITDIPH